MSPVVDLVKVAPGARKADGRNVDDDPPTVVVDEYKAVEVPLERDTAERIRRIVGRRLTVRPTDCPGHWRIEAGSHVGTVVAPGLRLLVRPKVRAANLFHLLGVEGAGVRFERAAFDYARSPDLLPAVGGFYQRALEATLARGLTRRYLEQEERLSAVRGRIDVAAQMRRPGLPIPIACRFDEHSADTPLNRIVREAALRLMRLPGVPSDTRRGLASMVVQLDEVGAFRESDRARPITLTRLDEHYRHSLRLAEVVLDATSIRNDPADSSGAAASAFLVNMNTLYERFVEQGLRRALRGHLDVDGQRTINLDVDQKVRIRPDLVFRRGTRDVFVGDAKYKLADSGVGRDADYYQLLAYTTALDVAEGVLVYCHAGDAPLAGEVVVRYAGKRLWTRCISLAGAPEEVDAELDDVGAWILEKATGRSRMAGV
ncbi:hypothetical protein PO878_09395 [Iamia majanohamensis]|uniref:5-methylcytosine-specific restriction enzyme subunit McrC n=1 Tax=Iamia majanohamensis TaxID=467976 RepID=A0AAE9Y971_9ACTN|nr:hypothetical protein [Iamia majanohamensis]WCO68937.1 hypothetical protein PO878_09395 [Iamia majanohamensis]